MPGYQVPGDLALTADGRHLVITSGARLAKQSIEAASQIWRGYWFYDDSVGLPMLESILVKAPDLRVHQQIFRDWLAERPGVSRVGSVSCSLDRATRALTVRFAVVCEDGSTLADELSLAVG